jgi:PTH2 family peptidyl-tRNA hydrolase
MNADTVEYGGDLKLKEQDVTDAMKDWLTDKFTKICVSVNSEAELLEVYGNAKEKGLICSLITDAGLTEFNGVPTITCCAIGPVWSDEVDEITGKLSLL